MKPNFTFRINLLFLLLSLLIFNLTAGSGLFSAEATIRYVSKTGLSIPPYITWKTAADSIQECINISVFSDTIYVANGVYEEQVVMIPGLSLIGAGTDSCIVDSRSFPITNNRTITMQDACLVKSFYIRTSNNFDYGYGIWAEGQSGLITSNKFSNANTGIVLEGSNIEVYRNYCFNIRRGIDVFNSNSIVRRNEIYILTESGTGIYISAFNNNYAPLIDSNYIETISLGIGKGLGANPTIKNNTIKLINGSTGISLAISDSTKVYNNLIITEYGGEAIYNSGVTYLSLTDNYAKGNFVFEYAIVVSSNDVVKNNVVTDANGGIIAFGSNYIIKYNNAWNNDINYSGFTPDTTNLSVDPMIVNSDTIQGNLNFQLQKYSPLIDAGDPNILDKDSTRSDIGLYGGPYGESYNYVDLPPKAPRNLNANVADSTVTLTWNRNTEADISYYNLYCDTIMNFLIDSTKLVASIVDSFYYYIIPIGAESLYFKLTAIDNQENESNPSEEVAVILVSVKNEWVPVNNYILYRNYPNPFNPTTKIGYKLKERGYVKLYVYDVKGELVSVLVNQIQEAGYYEVEFNAEVGSWQSAVGKTLASGVYIYQIMVSNEKSIPVFSDIKKMVFIK